MRLRVETGPLAGTQVPLDRSHPVVLGSDPGCTVCIAEAGVAKEHAIVKALRDEGFGVKALAPGLRLNGREVDAAQLRDGDVLELGTTRLTYAAAAGQKGPHVTGFRILGELGKGGMGVVYRAEQVSLRREVALKLLDKKRTDDPQFVAKFVAEARAAAKLSHPNVVHVLDVDNDGGTYYYAMELMHHGSLEAWLKKNGKMPVERALQVVADAASGLAYAESLGIVHRDIKPDNLMLDQHGTVKIADLGLAFTEEDPEEQLAGTPHFMAPEQVLRKPVDHRTDLYALGCTFYRLVTGKTPFRGQAVKDILRAHVRDTAEPANKLEPSVPAEVAAIIARLMAKEPADRYQSANDLVEELAALLQPPAKKGLWIGLAAGAALIAGGAIWWAVTKPKEVVTIKERYADPEKQQFADQLVELRSQQKQDHATIALLRARLDGGQGLDLATALDAVVAAHPGTAAAEQAAALATATRTAVADQQARQQRALQLAEQTLAAARTRIDAAVGADDHPAALALADAITAPEGADAAAFTAGKASVRQSVRDRASARLETLWQQVEAARTAGDAAALPAAVAALQPLLRDGGWPDELVGDRKAQQQRLATAAAAARDLDAARAAAQWRSFATFAHGPDGIGTALALGDFATAAQRLTQRADADAAAAPAAHARALAAGLLHGAAFADLLAAAAERGELSLAHADGTPGTVLRWQRADGTFAVTGDPARKPVKETTVSGADLSIEQWQALAAQVAEPEARAGCRDAFLAGLVLQRHLRAAQDYLGRLRPADDDAGTGADGYPLSFAVPELLLSRLPQDAPWASGLRTELAAAQLLAQGLRALSERRNLAAAAYLERVCQEHAHTLCITALP